MKFSEMMGNAVNDQQWNETQATRSGNKPELPQRGAYRVQVIAAGLKQLTWGTMLRIQFDICEGAHKGYFTKLYKFKKAQSEQFGGDEPQFRGYIDVKVPDKNADDFQQQLGRFKGVFDMFNASNQKQVNLHSDEQELKGLHIGVMLTYKQYNTGDNEYDYADLRYFIPVNEIQGATIPNDRKARQNNQNTQNTWNNTSNSWNGNAAPPPAPAQQPPQQQNWGMGDFETIISDGDVPF